MYRQKPSSAVYLLDMKEISELWGWAYGTTVGRVYAAANTGRIHAFQRPGHQRFYLSDELEAVFGPPKIDAASKPAWWGWSELSDEDAEIAS